MDKQVDLVEPQITESDKPSGYKKGGKSSFTKRRTENKREFEKRIISIRRVSRTSKGGKRMRISVMVVVGDKKGKIGLAMGKGSDVKAAEEKAYNRAIKHMVKINLKANTIAHPIKMKHGAAKLILRPASPGTGIIAGSSIRLVLDVLGVKDILTKRLGCSSSITNAYATLNALKLLKN